ncbi:hypothetical protein [Paracoccus laeviglucosivorans]|uniref:Uncharacterized protein n=1 Tax=Paracoccus laeviglucosivorans TaxID=1197861 RepID=A0A521ERX8_9RHOB|nr:hypothetical protein [Paracoccus laeviglucosivorans]SMO86708.1 hypothetical protein SAMN06265221_11528 [Paracoccus laeviglucosivorans]
MQDQRSAAVFLMLVMWLVLVLAPVSHLLPASPIAEAAADSLVDLALPEPAAEPASPDIADHDHQHPGVLPTASLRDRPFRMAVAMPDSHRAESAAPPCCKRPPRA